MSKRPLKHFKLRESALEHKDFLRKINRAKNVADTKKLILKASPEQIRILENIIIAHFDPCQEIPINSHCFQRLKASRKLQFIKKAFAPLRFLNDVQEAKSNLLKCLTVLKIFTRNLLS